MDVVTRYHGPEQVERHRDHNFTLWLYQSDKFTPAALLADDIARFKIWTTADAVPALDLDSIALPTGTFTADAGTDTLTSVAHGLTNGQRVKPSSSGTIPGGLSASIVYYVISAAADTFQVSLTSGGAAVNITSAGTGTHTWTRVYSRVRIDDRGINGTTPAQIGLELYRDELSGLAVGEWNWEGSIVVPTDNNRIFPYALGTFDVVANSTGDYGTT